MQGSRRHRSGLRAFLVDYASGTNWFDQKHAPIAFEPKPLSVGGCDL